MTLHIVLETLLVQHDLILVALAGLMCALASFAGVSLLRHARRTTGAARYGWLAVAAVAVGFGVWATHFIAMLAFRQDIPVGYDITLTAMSLAIAIGVIGGGLWFAALGTSRFDMALGGAITGLGICVMHYVGMVAVIIGGEPGWDGGLVTASLLLGMGLGALALFLQAGRDTMGTRLASAGVLTLAICAMHFTSMGALDLTNCFAIVPEGDVTPTLLSIGIAVVGIVIIAAALSAVALDLRAQARQAAEARRMNALVDAAVEGLVILRDSRIVIANAAFAEMLGRTEQSLADVEADTLFARLALTNLMANPGVSYEMTLVRDDGTILPATIVARELEFGGASSFALAIRDLTAHKAQEQQLRYMAHHDALTGLANRVAFNRQLQKEIAHARRSGSGLAVLCLDLDRFKEVNDLFGHGAGDAVLQQVADCLNIAVGDGEMCARLGGDEFAVIVPDLARPEQAGRVAEDILATLRETNVAGSGGAHVAASIGIALYPADAETAEQLVSSADTALYRAKQDGRDCHRFFEAAMGAAVRDRRLLENDLRAAIARNELALVYQPQVDIGSGTVTGFEALLRWSHPERGMVSPAHFIPIAEESGLILSVGSWALRTACIEAASWSSPLTVAVNVSAVQLHAADFVEQVSSILEESRLTAQRLEIEITETALVRDMARAVTTLKAIKAMGVRVAMDDFGTGYSSLANLRAFPFDKIKVDRSFISAVDISEQSAAIVRAVLGLGSGLKVPVVAEGVEREEELDFLRRETCAEAQGYLLSRPLDISRFALITSGARRTLDESHDCGPSDRVRLAG